MDRHRITKSRSAKIGLLKLAGAIAIGCGLAAFVNFDLKISKVSAKSSVGNIETAMFTRQKFFGGEAIVPLPTARARENLARLAEETPDDPEILEKLAEVDEKLNAFDVAEKTLIRLAEIDSKRVNDLVAFYHRRARFRDEAKTLRQMLGSVEADNRPEIFEKILDLARTHDLKEYLQPDFYQQVANENANVFPIFEKLIDRLADEKNYAEALEFLRQAQAQFPEKKPELQGKEISILSDMGNEKEAEAVYIAAFDPFWPDERFENFYDFLNERDGLRDYGAGLKTRFDRNNADFDAAIRLAHYRSYRAIEIKPIILKLEKAKKVWTADELLTITRLLIRENEGDLASRFLYTLYNRDDLKDKGELRAKILYQLFEMFSDAGNQRLPLTSGDLRFYREAATIDTNPGIAMGILSLIFSDTDPGARLAEKEAEANKYFNRAAAYRIFLAYKDEFPTSPELGQMYLDIVRLYTATGEFEIAEKELNEFAERHENSTDFPQVALKLADAFAVAKNTEKSRQICQEIIDRLGDPGTPATGQSARDRNSGINIPPSKETPGTNSDGYFRDYLGRKSEPVTYREVLERLVDSLAKERKIPEILKLFSSEIKKYPQAEWLYEWRLSWLEQTNLTEEQLAAHQEALKNFQSATWSDKLARWFLRNNRRTQFEEFSTGLVKKLGDDEIENYLSRFIDSKVSAAEFEKQLYLKLYLTAQSRFPHNPAFVEGLLKFYKANNRQDEWRKLAAEYYFESKAVRRLLLDDLSQKGELRSYLARAESGDEVYKLFRADAAIRLSNYEQAIDAYRELNALYPNSPDFVEQLIALTRSFGQKDQQALSDAANIAHSQAEYLPSSAEFRTRSGELHAELGNYEKSKEEWDLLIGTASGSREIYLDAATVYWDYFQYRDALRTIGRMREKFADDALCAFESGAIHEALHDTPVAIGEYVKALDANRDETQKEKATKRLVTLAKRNGIERQIASAFAAERSRRKDSSFLALGYAEFLAGVKKPDQAENILDRAIEASRDNDFLESARHFYADENIKTGEQTALRRLAKTTESPRRTIRYGLQLAESLEESDDRDTAKSALAVLIHKFPNNYGVVTAVSDLYHRFGFETEAVDILQIALRRSQGKYRTEIAGKLSQRLILLDRLDSAEQILTGLHGENKADLDLFRDLADIYVRKNKPEPLRKAFNETIAALRKSDTDQRELDELIADFRTQMIDAFTRLKDYRSAIEQHIEIVNRDPEDEELTENAISYAKRHGGADALLAYYQKTSNEAFKNYRWNVVLARIFEAGGDLENAVTSYRAAIVNQPEMVELYVTTADLETRRHNFCGALKDIDAVLELTNYAPEYVKKKIEVLKKAGRNAEAEAEKSKLPEDKLKIGDDRFAEASKLRNSENGEDARRIYREAFGALLENPLNGEMTTAGITGYVQSLREEEPLDKIGERLWSLREKLIGISVVPGSTKTGEARRRLSMLEAAMVESVGNILKTVATDGELAAIHDDLLQRIAADSPSAERHRTIGLIQNLSRRAGFGELEEKILLKKLNEADSAARQNCLRDVVNFYDERGAYEKAFIAVEKYSTDDLPLLAEHARLAGNSNKELEALRAIYRIPRERLAVDSDSNIARYLEILYKVDREELSSLTLTSSAYQLQLINFLLAVGERELAHAAIENSSLPTTWKLSRHAETSLALREFDAGAECYFCEALQFDSIGGMVSQTPDKERFLVGDDWFRLTREYGEWLYRSPLADKPPSLYLAAMLENRPRSPADQSSLGSFYLGNKKFKAATEHFRIAVEQNPDDTATKADLGSAYLLAGKTDWANEMFDRAILDVEPKDLLVYFKALQRFGLDNKARTSLLPKIVEFLEGQDVDNSQDFQNLIRSIAASFDAEARKATYFKDILIKRPTDTSLAKMLLDESLVDQEHVDFFYERLSSMSSGMSNYDSDYNFAAIRRRTWATEDAESIYDHENDYQIEEPENERLIWQRKFLEVLLERRENRRAAELADRIAKELSGRYARPAWLRLAQIRLNARNGRFDLREAERFTGVVAGDAVSEIKPPNIERFNDVARMLKEEGLETDVLRLSESYFARNLALGQLDSANFLGFARALFAKGEIETATRLLQLMIDVNTEATRLAAIAEIDGFEAIKDHAVDAAKLGDVQEVGLYSQSGGYELAAQISVEFNRPDSAITFRQALLDVAPQDASNKIKLAGLIDQTGDKNAAVELLRQIVDDRNVGRALCWQAKWKLRQMGANSELNDVAFDPFSQFYNGLLAAESNENHAAASFFVASLIAGNETEISPRQELIKVYAAGGRPFAALKLAGTDKSEKPDELLRMLSEAAEQTGDFATALEFEKLESGGGSSQRIATLRELSETAARKATDFVVDQANTRKL